jgi:hypothetical protein
MMQARPQAPPARVTLRAHYPAPARVELAYRPLPGRVVRTLLSLAVFWGAIPLLLWVPPHYPWVMGAFCAGLYLAHKFWTGRYRVFAFAGVCPRCGGALALGPDRTIDLPHTLTCYRCHFEPLLEVSFEPPASEEAVEHHHANCVGRWSLRWLADEAYLVCEVCHASSPASPDAQRAADAENERGHLLAWLANEGRPLL